MCTVSRRPTARPSRPSELALPTMATATATMTAPAAVAGPSSERQRHVPLACFGNGRRTERTRNDKMPRKQPDIFVPSKALEEFIGKMPQVRSTRSGRGKGEGGRPCHVRRAPVNLLTSPLCPSVCRFASLR